MSTDDALLRFRKRAFALAEELGNVCAARLRWDPPLDWPAFSTPSGSRPSPAPRPRSRTGCGVTSAVTCATTRPTALVPGARPGHPTRGRTRESVLGKAKMWPLSRGCVGRSRNKEDTLGAGRRRAPRTVRVDGCGTLQSRIASPARVRKLRRRRFTAPGESGSGHYARRALPTRSRARWNAAASAATGRSAA